MFAMTRARAPLARAGERRDGAVGKHATGGAARGTARVGRARRGLIVTNVATPSKGSSDAPKRSKVEIIKENSDYLRHPLIAELATEASFISEDAAHLYKFHGGYHQDERE